MNKRRLGKWAMSLALASCLVGAGCKKARQPNTKEAEDRLLFEWGQALVVADKQGALGFYDLDLRQKLELWDKTLKPLSNHAKKADALAAAVPRLGDAAALATVGDEAWKEVKDQPWLNELADGKCVSGAPTKDDIGKGVVPHEKKDMPQELGLWLFELRTAIAWAPAFRVQCPTAGTFWIQLARRKKDQAAIAAAATAQGPNAAASSDDAPLKVIRILP